MRHDLFGTVFNCGPMTTESCLSSPHAFLGQHTARKTSAIPLLCILALLPICALSHSSDAAIGQPPMADGIQPLIQLDRRPLHQLIPLNIRPLLLPHEQEQFLQELEGLPPDWHALQKLDHTQQSERLFQRESAKVS